jgi:hypothetical protein
VKSGPTMARYGTVITVVMFAALLAACGGKAKPTATPVSATVAPSTNLATAPASVTNTPIAATPTSSAATPTSSPVPATPTPLAIATAAVVATGTALSATSAALTGATPAGTVAASDPAAQTVVDKARVRFDKINTLHFALTIDGDVFLDKLRTQKLKSADGDLVRPDKVAVTAKAAVGPINAQLKFIQIADNAYLTNILTGKWEKAPQGFAYDPRLVFDRDKGVTAILTRVGGWSLVDTMKINGTDTQHVRASVPVESVNDLVSFSLRGDMVDVDLYVEPKNNDVVRLVIGEQVSAVTAGTVAARWTLDLSKQNDNIKIDPPTLGA